MQSAVNQSAWGSAAGPSAGPTDAHQLTLNKRGCDSEHEQIASTSDRRERELKEKEETIAALQRENAVLKESKEELIARLECPVCLDTCGAPIYSCPNGHILCYNCQPSVLVCPTCRDPGKPKIRNIFAETFSSHWGSLCVNNYYGCKKFLITGDKEHLPDCEYRYVCQDCHDYRGGLPGLRQHIGSTHPDLYSVGQEWEGIVLVKRKVVFRCLSYHNLVFRCSFVKDHTDSLFLYVQFFGPRDFAANYKCWFDFTSGDGEFKCSYLIRCQDTSVEFKKTDLGIVDSFILNKLMKNDNTLCCKIRIV